MQRWILGRKLAEDDNQTLAQNRVTTEGCPVFLYLVAPRPMVSDQLEVLRQNREGVVKKVAAGRSPTSARKTSASSISENLVSPLLLSGKSNRLPSDSNIASNQISKNRNLGAEDPVRGNEFIRKQEELEMKGNMSYPKILQPPATDITKKYENSQKSPILPPKNTHVSKKQNIATSTGKEMESRQREVVPLLSPLQLDNDKLRNELKSGRLQQHNKTSEISITTTQNSSTRQLSASGNAQQGGRGEDIERTESKNALQAKTKKVTDISSSSQGQTTEKQTASSKYRQVVNNGAPQSTIQSFEPPVKTTTPLESIVRQTNVQQMPAASDRRKPSPQSPSPKKRQSKQDEQHNPALSIHRAVPVQAVITEPSVTLQKENPVKTPTSNMVKKYLPQQGIPEQMKANEEKSVPIVLRNNVSVAKKQDYTAKTQSPPQVDPTDGWICPSCTLVNPIQRPGCEACAEEKPSDIKKVSTPSSRRKVTKL